MSQDFRTRIESLIIELGKINKENGVSLDSTIKSLRDTGYAELRKTEAANFQQDRMRLLEDAAEINPETTLPEELDEEARVNDDSMRVVNILSSILTQLVYAEDSRYKTSRVKIFSEIKNLHSQLFKGEKPLLIQPEIEKTLRDMLRLMRILVPELPDLSERIQVRQRV